MHQIKRLSLLTYIGLALFAFVACGSGTGNSADADSQSGEATATDHPARVAQGEQIALADFAVEGQTIVFDFMSDYCPPCERMSPWMDRLHAERDDITVVKVDINRPGKRGIDWGSPVAQQFRLQSIPHFKVMNAKGDLLAEGDPAQEMVIAWLQALPAPGS